MPKLWLPPEKLDQITIYQDEAFLFRKTGVIKAAIAIADSVRRPFEQALAPVLEVHQAEEFKAGKINIRNLRRYREFLRFIVNVVAETGLQSPLRSIISVESASIYRGKLFSSVRSVYENAFARYQVATRLIDDLAELSLWCGGQLRHIVPGVVANPLAFVVDERYRNDLRVAEQKWFNSPMLGFATPLPIRELLPGMLGVALDLLRTRFKGEIPRITIVGVDFARSVDSVYLQAADLLANLTFNYLQYKKGINSESAKLRHDLLANAIDDAGPGEELMQWLRVVDEGKDGPKLTGADDLFVGRITLGPINSTPGT